VDSPQDSWRSRAQTMATQSQSNPYRCDQCGTGELVAVPLLYQQGTRTFTSTFSSGISQSYSAQIAAPPHPRGYIRPFVLWGFAICLFFAWSYAGLSSVLEHPATTAMRGNVVVLFMLLCVASFMGLLLNVRSIVRYNHEIFPQLQSDWAHTYMCRRCGKFRLIPS
jgi:hypothetical protein